MLVSFDEIGFVVELFGEKMLLGHVGGGERGFGALVREVVQGGVEGF